MLSMSTHLNSRLARWGSAVLSIVFGLILICMSPSASSTTVFVTLPQAGQTTTSSTIATDSASFASASADLGIGLYKASLTGTLNQTGLAAAGIQPLPNALRLTNGGSAGRVFPSVRVTGDYMLTSFGTSALGGGSSANAFARLSVKQGGNTYTVSGQHVVNKVFDKDGNVTSFANNFNPIVASGGNLIVAESSLDHLDMTLVAPTLTILPGTFIDVWFELRVTGASTVGIGAADFSNSAQFSLLVDPGVSLTSDAGVPLVWITTIPEPAAAWLFGGGLLGLLRVVRLRATPSCLRKQLRPRHYSS
jgi:hypothetical protein